MKVAIKNILLVSISTVLVVVLIAMTSRRHDQRQVNDLIINIDDQQGAFFVDQFEVTALINAENTDYVLGLDLDQLDLRELEARVERNAFVTDAQVYLDITGNLQVHVTQARPLARVLFPDGGSQYIDVSGTLLPLNTRHTARVPIVELEKNMGWTQSVLENEFGTDLLAMLRYVDADPFWKAQIAHIIVDPSGELSIIPQVTRQRVLFGTPTAYVDKLSRLRLFYDEILPAKGWNSYEYVNVKYNNQIVCK